MSKVKEKSLYYPLTHEELLHMTSNLTPAQLKVYLYLKTLGPFEDSKVEICINDAAKKLNLDRSTVSRALKFLDSEGFIDLELIQVSAKVSMAPKRNRAIASCDLAIASCDLAIASCDRHAHPPIYIDRARATNFSNFSNPQTRGEGNFENSESISMTELLNSLQDQINTLREAMVMGEDKSSAPIEFHQKDIKVTSDGAPVEFCQEDITVEVDAPVEFRQEDITVEANAPVKFYQEQIEVSSSGEHVNFYQKNTTVRNLPHPLQHIPQELINRLNNAGIPLDGDIVAALQTVHKSQVLGAIQHIEKFRDTIKSPKKVFLFQLPKQSVCIKDIKDKLGLWREYWFNLPLRRPKILEEIQSECLSGEVVVQSEEIGPVLVWQD